VAARGGLEDEVCFLAGLQVGSVNPKKKALHVLPFLDPRLRPLQYNCLSTKLPGVIRLVAVLHRNGRAFFLLEEMRKFMCGSLDSRKTGRYSTQIESREALRWGRVFCQAWIIGPDGLTALGAFFCRLMF